MKCLFEQLIHNCRDQNCSLNELFRAKGCFRLRCWSHWPEHQGWRVSGQARGAAESGNWRRWWRIPRRSRSSGCSPCFWRLWNGANIFFVELACHYPALDGFNQHFPASVHFPLTSTVDKSQQHQHKFSGMPRIEPGAAEWEARMLPLCSPSLFSW